MKKAAVIVVLTAFIVPGFAFAHKGEVHSYMGTVIEVTANRITLKDTKGEKHALRTSESTTYSHWDNHLARRSELKVGMRVVARIAKDGETVTSVKFAARGKK